MSISLSPSGASGFPAPAAAPPSRPAPASHPDILPVPDTAEEKPTEHSWTTVASGLPIRQDATLHSPASAPTESEPEAPAFAAALGEGALDIEPDSANLPEHQDHMAAWDPPRRKCLPPQLRSRPLLPRIRRNSWALTCRKALLLCAMWVRCSRPISSLSAGRNLHH